MGLLSCCLFGLCGLLAFISMFQVSYLLLCPKSSLFLVFQVYSFFRLDMLLASPGLSLALLFSLLPSRTTMTRIVLRITRLLPIICFSLILNPRFLIICCTCQLWVRLHWILMEGYTQSTAIEICPNCL